jgi:predicted 2-oxoglutarate/Fe(II)-dependent dioxygenase YbiX|tara:strand:+ start:51 stop:617 length:567 start_codon:yes stop_codon:yes gene_type:complete
MTVRKQAFMHYSDQPLLDLVEDIYKAAPPLEIAGSTSKDPNNHRVSKTSWILPEGDENIAIFEKLFGVAMDASTRAKWNFEAEVLEPLQYTHYGVGDKYDWHVDQIIDDEDNENCRKLSFTLLLNDDFEGGNLDIECGSPGNPERVKTIELQKGDIVFFPSYLWHRVTPVTSGERHSLVGWIQGPVWK